MHHEAYTASNRHSHYASALHQKTSIPKSALSRISRHVGQMSSIQLRNRKVKNDGIDNSSLANETVTQKHEVKTAEITRTDSLEPADLTDKSLLSQLKGRCAVFPPSLVLLVEPNYRSALTYLPNSSSFTF